MPAAKGSARTPLGPIFIILTAVSAQNLNRISIQITKKTGKTVIGIDQDPILKKQQPWKLTTFVFNDTPNDIFILG